MDRFTSFKAPADEEKGFFSRLFNRFSSPAPAPATPTATRHQSVRPAPAPARQSTPPALSAPASPTNRSTSPQPSNPAAAAAASTDQETPNVRVNMLPGAARRAASADAGKNIEATSRNGSSQPSKDQSSPDESGSAHSFRMNHELASVCYQCDQPFTVLNRRHHCVACAQIFCGKCTRRTDAAGLRLPKQVSSLMVRICDFCFATLRIQPTSGAGRQSLDESGNTTPGMVRNNRSYGHLPGSRTMSLLDGSALDIDEMDDDEERSGQVEQEELLSKNYKRISIANLQTLMRSSTLFDPEDYPVPPTSTSPPESPKYPNDSPDKTQSQEKTRRRKKKKQNDIVDSTSTENTIDDDNSSTSSASSEEYQDLGREAAEEEHLNKWFSQPLPQYEAEEVIDPLRSDQAYSGIKPSRSSKDIGSLKKPTSATPDSIRRLPIYKTLSRAHFKKDSDIALPATPEVRNVRSVSHSLLEVVQKDDGSSFSVHEAAFRTLSVGHLEYICDRLVEKYRLEERWKKLMISFADKAVVNLKVNVQGGDEMDVLHYVKVKAIPGGSYDECSYIEGFVFDGNRMKRKTKSNVLNAKVLLLGCSVEFERRENVLMSIEKVLQQEREYLTMLCAKVAAAQPNVIFVEKNVSLFAQDILAEKGITLLVNVKPHVLQTISRLTGASILQSTDHVSSGDLGKCQSFSIDTFTGPWGQKSCVIVRGPPTHYGTIILRGAPEETLEKVKSSIQFLIYSAYNMVLENHLLYQQTATTVVDAFSIMRTKTLPAKLFDDVDSGPAALQPPSILDDPLLNIPKDESLIHLDYEGKLIATSWSVAIPKEANKAKGASNNKQDSDSNGNTTFDSTSSLNKSDGTSNGTTSNQLSQHQNSAYQVCPTISLPPVAPDLQQTNEIRLDNGTYEVPVAPQPALNFSYRSLVVPTDLHCSDPEIPILPAPSKNSRPPLPYLQIKHLRSKRIHKFKNFAPQHIIYLHSLYCPATSMHCLPFTPQIIHYYSANDMTLGQFLENFCFNEKSRCLHEECHRPTSEHERCIMHAGGRINIAVRPFDPSALSNQGASAPGTGPAGSTRLDPKTILMWAACKNLQRQTPYLVPMSRETWNFSLGKFFELIFYSAHTLCRTCSEPTYRGHTRYFYYKNMVVMFEYEAVKAYETQIPPMQVSVDQAFAKQLMVQEIDEIVKSANKMYEMVLTKVLDLEDACTKLDDEEELRSVTQQHRYLEEEKAQFFELVDKERIAVATTDSTTLFQVARLRRLFYFNIRRWSETVSNLEVRVQKKWKTFMATIKEKEKQEAKEREKQEKLKAKEVENSAPTLRDDPYLSGGRSRSKSNASDETTRVRSASNATDATTPTAIPALPSVPENGPLIVASPVLESVSELNRSRNSSSPLASSSTLIRPPGAVSQEVLIENVLSPPPGAVLEVPHLNATTHSLLRHSGSSQGNTEDADAHSSEGVLPNVAAADSSSDSSSRVTPDAAGDAADSSSQEANISNFRSKLLSSEGIRSRSASQSNGPTTPRGTSSAVNIPLGGSSGVPQDGHPLGSLPKETPVLFVGQAPVSSTPSATHSVNFGRSAETAAPSSRFREALSMVLPTKKTQILDMMEDSTIHVFQPDSNTEPTVAIYENEPSSIIAYALMSDRYRDKMNTFAFVPPGTALNFNTPAGAALPPISPGLVADLAMSSGVPTPSSSLSSANPTPSPAPIPSEPLTKPGDDGTVEDSDQPLPLPTQTPLPIPPTSPLASSGPQSNSPNPMARPLDPKMAESNPLMETAYKGLVSPDNTTIDLEWKNCPIWGGPKIQMQCKTYYARQFAWLRNLIGLDEKIFAQSLSRCKPWKARGGKSNSRFARTLDQRFIIKQVQPIELESFLAFAPLYFDYFSKVYFQQVPTAICKIVGIYSVTMNRKGKTPIKVDLIVQENLFHGHNITRTFDLKGSHRARYARPESPDDKDVVLLDQNLLEMMYGDPICVSNEAKAMLAMTVWNDTLCLSSLNVMDYSLLVGVDETNGKLILGIIDYMRTYTWDKQLETWVKRSGLLGGGGGGSSKVPTVISPKQYKKRFRMHIWAYFLLIPHLNTRLAYDFLTGSR